MDRINKIFKIIIIVTLMTGFLIFRSMDRINDIVKIILAHKYIITWIVIGWMLIAFYVLKPIHGWPKWKGLVRGIGEVTLGGWWMILSAVLFHFLPGLAILLVITFCFFHYKRLIVDIRSCESKLVPRKVVGPIVLGIFFGALSLSWYFLDWNPFFDFKRGVAQLTSNTVFPDAGKSCKHWFSCDCAYPMRKTGIRPSESNAASAESNPLPSRLKKISLSSNVTVSKKQTPPKAK